MCVNESNSFTHSKNLEFYSNRFNMTVEQNVFCAKRNIVDTIWKSAHLEGINVTYPETECKLMIVLVTLGIYIDKHYLIVNYTE